MMKSPTSIIAGTVAGVFAVGAFTGWMAPSVLRAARADTVLAAAGAASTHSTAATQSPVPLGTAPNYRAIVAQNRAAVVGITTAGEMKVASSQPFGFDPFGNDGDNPL